MDILYSPTQAAKYAKFIEDSYSWKYQEKPTVIKHLKSTIKSSTHAIDAGCGTGHSTKLLLDLGVKAKNVMGTDISSDMLDVARKFLPNVKFTQANLPDLKFKRNSLDLVLSVMVFHFLSKKDYEKTIKNISKSLVKGGCLFFIALHPLRYTHDHADYFKDKLKIEKTPWGTKLEYYRKTISDYLGVLLSYGFELVSVEEPVPSGKGARNNAKEYKKYSSVPTRLAVKVIKK